jgi:hypothetical protein
MYKPSTPPASESVFPRVREGGSTSDGMSRHFFLLGLLIDSANGGRRQATPFRHPLRVVGVRFEKMHFGLKKSRSEGCPDK